MDKKYQKPIARNLGEVVNAQGYCRTGSVATSESGQNCESGGTAIAGCGPGLFGFWRACSQGSEVSYSCNDGGIAF